MSRRSIAPPLAPLLLTATIAGLAAVVHAQISNPIDARIAQGTLAVEVRDLTRLPDTRALLPPGEDVNPAGWARINVVRDLPDGRRFVNDSRGFIYLLDRGQQPAVYLNIRTMFPHTFYNRLASGLVGFDFHPEFATNGLR